MEAFKKVEMNAKYKLDTIGMIYYMVKSQLLIPYLQSIHNLKSFGHAILVGHVLSI